MLLMLGDTAWLMLDGGSVRAPYRRALRPNTNTMCHVQQHLLVETETNCKQKLIITTMTDFDSDAGVCFQFQVESSCCRFIYFSTTLNLSLNLRAFPHPPCLVNSDLFFPSIRFVPLFVRPTFLA